MAYAATLKNGGNFNVLFRFVITPLFLFSGVFFPIDRLPEALQTLAGFTPLFHGVELTRGLTLGTLDRPTLARARRLPRRDAGARHRRCVWTFNRKLRRMTVTACRCVLPSRRRSRPHGAAQPARLQARRGWSSSPGSSSRCSICSSLGIGLGAMVPDVDGVSYTRVRRARPAGVELHERRDHRRLLQHLLQAALSEDLRRHPGHADARARRRVRRDAVGARRAARSTPPAFLVVVLVLGEFVRTAHAPLAVGGPGVSGGGPASRRPSRRWRSASRASCGRSRTSTS